MKGNKVYNVALIKLIGAYALFTGIIASIFLFFIVVPKQKEITQNPSVTPTKNTEGQFCGGIAAIQCPTGYRCKLSGNYPDAGGTCVRQVDK